MNENRVRAIRFRQKGRVFYVAAVPVGRLLKVVEVDVWHPGTANPGYQRAPSAARQREIARYLDRDDAVMPAGGMLNARRSEGSESSYGTVLVFDSDAEPHLDPGSQTPIETGWLTLPPPSHPLWIVDMQHRLGGFDVAIREGAEDLAEFPVVVTIADGLSKLEEIEQFELINTTQKKVRTDLARRLLSIRAQDPAQRARFKRQQTWQARGPIVVDWLNRNCPVWAGRIAEPNTSRKERPGAISRETSFVTSLKPLLTTPLLSRGSDDWLAELLGWYWEALSEVWPEAFSDPTNFVIQKTPGVYSLHMIAPDVFELARQGLGLDEHGLRQAVKPLHVLPGSFWHKESGTAAQFGSMKGFSVLAGELQSHLPKIDLSEIEP